MKKLAGLLLLISSTAYAIPTVTSVTPSSVNQGSPDTQVTVSGSSFTVNSVVLLNNQARPTVFINSETLSANIPSSDLVSPGDRTLNVFNSEPEEGASNTVIFTVNAVQNVPTITSLVPNSRAAGLSSFTLQVNGSNFAPDAVIQWDGQNRNTTFINSTQLSTEIADSEIATVRNVAVNVVNPGPQGGVSSSLIFPITDEEEDKDGPLITSLSPSSIPAGSGDFVLTVSGINLRNGSVVRWDGQDRPTTRTNSRRLSVNISAADVATAGIKNVVVFSPGDKGGTSPAFPFVVSPVQGEPNVPTLTSLSPTTRPAGSGSFLLTISGNNFQRNSVVLWNGQSRETVAGTNSLTATILASDLETPGTATVLVLNPGPNGGVSPTGITFRITPAAGPAPEPTPGNPSRASDFSQMRVFPDPWSGDKHKGIDITFDGLTQDSTIKIYTISARWVKSLTADASGTATWNLTNESGENIASGYYVYLITDSSGHKKTGKLAVLK